MAQPVVVASETVRNGGKYTTGRVVARREITPELWIVRIRPAEQITFVPGQYVTVGLPEGARVVERPYSIASSPRESDLEFFLELVSEGELSPHLYQVQVGGEVYLRRAAKGRFLSYDMSVHPHHLLVASVTGVAPYISLVREMAARCQIGEQIPGSYVILQSASHPQEFGYFDELSAHAQRHAWLHYVPTISRIWEAPDWRGERGRAEDVIRLYLERYGFTPADTAAWLCGNPAMIEKVKGVLERAGFPKSSVREEMYWVAR